ncbi:ABC transporter substrate-binding protein [Corynebacterium bovis]|uniref:ABC transporter substrate-binding protein n=1 Tax=Corynebacterium bovis TaxID=36808 RepID=A0A3R8QD82_9CORY|nr:ABC transporter substrate-binding protein [Corynebacterium bovis]MDN8580249.1 ABC transporter substrate-binding protein [Corynebacterium bovis]RRO85660.1 ABC transporter substrate-binding protein [Corynebacterium bovis]RRO86536.1 ABC transporter substrate-binding protein [Corynebacterium bovis]
MTTSWNAASTPSRHRTPRIARTHRTPRITRTVTAAVLTAAVGLLAACGSGDNGIDGDVTVDHAYGQTALPSDPDTVVSLSPGYTDAMLQLGEQPAAVTGFAGFPSAVMPWEDGKLSVAPDGPTRALQMMNPSDVPMEKIAEVAPEAVLASSMVTDRSMYDELTKIAPTVPALVDGKLDVWQDQTRVVGRMYGREDDADRLIADTEQHVRDVGAAHPGLAGKTVAVALYGGPDNIQVVTDPEDPTMKTLSLLGLSVPEQLKGLGGGEGGVQGKLSLENVDQLDADIIILGSMGDATPLTDSPLWSSLPAVKQHRVAELDAAGVTAFRVPTALSVPWSIDTLAPVLDTF